MDAGPDTPDTGSTGRWIGRWLQLYLGSTLDARLDAGCVLDINKVGH